MIKNTPINLSKGTNNTLKYTQKGANNWQIKCRNCIKRRRNCIKNLYNYAEKCINMHKKFPK